MRVLVVADDHPWPARSGFRLRLEAIVTTLSAVHEVDLVAVAFDPAAPVEPAPGRAGLRSSRVVPSSARAGSRWQRVLRWVRSDLPREQVLAREWGPLRAAVAEALSAGDYDAVWCGHVATWAVVEDLLPGRVVLDLDNLDAAVLRARRRARGAGLRHWVDVVDERRWRRLQDRAARSAASLVVCSDLDRDRLGAGPKVVVVPNGYELPEPSPGQEPALPLAVDGPVLLMVGLLTYTPNLDGARWFAERVLPVLRSRSPGTTLVLVGRYRESPEVAALRAVPGVVLRGEALDVAAELARADAVVVPVRYGGGTRIKILEAFAHRVPVVSTSAGCEGLDVVPGEHLLVADGAAAVADACSRLLADPGLAARLAAAGHLRWQEGYRWEAVRPQVHAALDRALAPR